MPQSTACVATPERPSGVAHGGEHPSSLLEWVARELHDQPVQALTVALLDLERARRACGPDLGEQLDRVDATARQALGALREMIEVLRTASPESVLDPTGPPTGTEALLGSRLRQFGARTGISVSLSVAPGWPASMGAATAAHLGRILDEALANVAKHSGASRVRVTLTAPRPGRLQLRVADNGVWHVDGRVADERRHHGIQGMQERAALLGGTLQVRPVPGDGTTVVVSLAATATPDPAGDRR